MKVLVTGGAGFIGSHVVRQALCDGHSVVNVDALTYAGSLERARSFDEYAAYSFERVNICDAENLKKVFSVHAPDGVIHLAAESHVDRSITSPAPFIETNINGTFTLLEAMREDWNQRGRPADYRFLHVSTDEVFGSLGATGAFCERTPYAPNSPYSASKAASDHLVRAWGRTYGLPTVIAHGSNTFGPFQHAEKLIPTVIWSALKRQDIPVFGDGTNVRDWLYVEDHARALLTLLRSGRAGQSYNIGGNLPLRNIDLVEMICGLIDRQNPDGAPHYDLVSFRRDRAGHDYRYCLDTDKIYNELGWRAQMPFKKALASTVEWYVKSPHVFGAIPVPDGS